MMMTLVLTIGALCGQPAPASPSAATQMIAQVEKSDWLSPAQKAAYAATIKRTITADTICPDKLDHLAAEFPRTLQEERTDLRVPEGERFTLYCDHLAWRLQQWQNAPCLDKAARETTQANLTEFGTAAKQWVDQTYSQLPDAMRTAIASEVSRQISGSATEVGLYFHPYMLKWTGPEPKLDGIKEHLRAKRPDLLASIDKGLEKFAAKPVAEQRTTEVERVTREQGFLAWTAMTAVLLEKYITPADGTSAVPPADLAKAWVDEVTRVAQDRAKQLDEDARKGPDRGKKQEELRDKGKWKTPGGVPQPPADDQR